MLFVSKPRSIFPEEVLDMSPEQLKRKLGFRPATARKKQHWIKYDSPFLNSDDYIGVWKPTTIFRSEYLFRARILVPERTPYSYNMHQIAALILYGPVALDDLVDGKQFPPKGRKCYARKWGLDVCTPGLIAACVVFVRSCRL
jgi:hypothetical protein